MFKQKWTSAGALRKNIWPKFHKQYVVLLTQGDSNHSNE